MLCNKENSLGILTYLLTCRWQKKVDGSCQNIITATKTRYTIWLLSVMLHFYTENLQQCISCTVSRQASTNISQCMVTACYCYEGARLLTHRVYYGILRRSGYNDIPMKVVVQLLVLPLCIWAAVGSVHGWLSCSNPSLPTCNSSDSIPSQFIIQNQLPA